MELKSSLFCTLECNLPQIQDPDDPQKCCEPHPLGDGTQCACVSPQIDDNDDPGTCCDAHALGDGTKCACVFPQINDPYNDGECCDPDSTNPSVCAISKSYHGPLALDSALF